MKIINIIPGFGGTFYCGNCLRDSGYVAALREEGHEAVRLPLYLPLTTQFRSEDPEIPVFYGAVSIYLKQSIPILKNMPAWAEKLLNSEPVLKMASRQAGSTRATGMEELTLTMINDRRGLLRQETDQLLAFLRDHARPDVVHLSNALLIGIAAAVKKELGIPVVCSLQDEDVWVDAMAENLRDTVWDAMAEQVPHVDAFITVSNYFGSVMQQKMRIPDEKLHILPIGVNPANYEINQPATSPPTLGFLSRLSPGNGLAVLTGAFIELRRNPAFSNLRLRLTGGMTNDNKPFLDGLMRQIKANGLESSVEIHHDFTTTGLKGFFRGLTLLSVPVLEGEAFGLYQLESMASGIPVVMPALGAFPEIVTATGGGVTYEPNTPQALAQAITSLLHDPRHIEQLSKQGLEAVNNKYNHLAVARQAIDIYKNISSR